MYIVQVASECAPAAKVGGLADVVYGLSRELDKRIGRVEVILPKYDCMRYDLISGLKKIYNDMWVPWYGGAIRCDVWAGEIDGLRCFFIDPDSQDNFFNRGQYYGFWDEPMRFAFFSKAALEFMLKTGRRPDIIHCHDWQTGLVPVLLFEMYQHFGMSNSRVCFTIHNFQHQGTTGESVLRATGLGNPDHYFHYDRMRDNFNPFALNPLKAGIVYSNAVTTVSPQYAWEVVYTDQNFGLGHTLEIHRRKFSGVLNGIDYGVWSPEVDRHIPARYSPEDLDGKYRDKDALRARFNLRQAFKPIVSFVGRLDPQKGLSLIQHALRFSLENDAQFVLLGSSPNPGINSEFWDLKNQLNGNRDCHLELRYDEELSHLIYAGSDLLIVPSMFEPCGLTQMIALKYGTVPVVRAVGGLVNTVFDRDYSSKPLTERNGYVFHDTDYRAIETALTRAIGLWLVYPEEFCELMKNGMRYDFSWRDPGQRYLEIYQRIWEKAPALVGLTALAG
jgi:starch synthase